MQENRQEKSQIKQNILLYLRVKGVSEYRFYKDSGITRGVLQQPNGISEENLSRFLDYAEDINSEWLLTGRGEMLKTNCITDDSSGDMAETATHKDNIKIASRHEIRDLNVDLKPRIPVDAAAGALSISSDPISQNGCEMLPIIPRFPKYDFTIIAKGDSMIPEIASGDELACRFISQRNFIQWGRTHVLDTAQGVVVKRIFDQSDSIVCRSANTAYPDFLIAKEEIYHIALVVGLIRQY